jgi:hypothetical protein
MKTLVALAIILAINVFLFLGDYGIRDINGQSSGLINYQNDMIGKFDAGNYTLDESVTSKLPSGEGSISPETGNFFTDTFSTIKNWFVETTGLNYLIGIVNAVPNFLKRFLDPVLAYAIGFFWHALTIFLIINFIKGGE